MQYLSFVDGTGREWLLLPGTAYMSQLKSGSVVERLHEVADDNGPVTGLRRGHDHLPQGTLDALVRHSRELDQR